jgi:hypothetical protein
VNPSASGGAGALQDSITWTPALTYKQHAGAPNIPDTGLGWEMTTGFNWQLLDRYTLGCLLSYWPPVVPSYPFGINPNRTIDPVVGGEVTLKVDF